MACVVSKEIKSYRQDLVHLVFGPNDIVTLSTVGGSETQFLTSQFLMESAIESDAPGEDQLSGQKVAKQDAMPSGENSDSQVWNIHNVQLSGLGIKHGKDPLTTQPHYVRDESRKLWQALEATILVDKPFVILNVIGDPGLGKSFTCFGWAAYQKSVNKAKICFITQEWSKYQYTTLEDTNVRFKSAEDRDALEGIAREAAAGIYVIDNFEGPKHTSCSPASALHTILHAAQATSTKVTIILCSSTQTEHPQMKSYASDQYSLRTHFMRGWTADELVACWYLSNTLQVPMLPQELIDDKLKFAARLRVASGNMHYMYMNDDNVTTYLNCTFMSISIHQLLRDGFSYGRPAMHNELFVHKKEWEVRLLNEYMEDQFCAKIRENPILTARLLNIANAASPRWFFDLYMRFVFQYAKDFNMQLIFHKHYAHRWRLLPPRSLKIRIGRIVKFGPILTDLTEWYIAPNETVAFIPGNTSQSLFHAVYVQRGHTDMYEVYFFKATYFRPEPLLCADGGYFLATLFPEFLCSDKDGSNTARLKMKRLAEQRQRDIDTREEMLSKKCPDSEKGVCNGSSDMTNGLDVLPIECLSQVLPPANHINRPSRIRLHFYLVTGKEFLLWSRVFEKEVWDIECMSRFDPTFTADNIHFTCMTLK